MKKLIRIFVAVFTMVVLAVSSSAATISAIDVNFDDNTFYVHDGCCSDPNIMLGRLAAFEQIMTLDEHYLLEYLLAEESRQLTLEFFEREEIIIEVSSMDEMLAFPRSDHYRYTFVLPMEDPEARNMSNWCTFCGQRTAGIFREVRVNHIIATTCPVTYGMEGLNDLRITYTTFEYYRCLNNCFRQRLSHWDSAFFFECNNMGGWMTSRFQVRQGQFCRNGFNPHTCWTTFTTGSFWNCWR